MKASEFPEMESLEIELVESWTEGDMFTKQPKIQRFTRVEDLRVVPASFGDPNARNYNSFDLLLFLRSTYMSKKTEALKSLDYVDSSKRRKGDDGRIDRHAVCRIKYKSKKTSEQPAS